MAIADELTKLEANRANIVAAINSKGGGLAENAGLAACPEAIAGLSGAGGTISWTGHVDEAGLRYIGWDDADIANLKANICWNEEDDADYAVPQDHKDLWDACEKVVVNGRTMIAYSELSKWKAIDFYLRYLPMVDTSAANGNVLFSEMVWLNAIPNIDTSGFTSMSRIFRGCTNLLYIPNLVAPNVINAESFAEGCKNLMTCYISGMSSVTNMYGMFYGCSSLREVPLLNTSSATNMQSMFQGCSSLREVPLLDTSSVTNMQGIFNGCSSLREVPLLDTSSVTNMQSMFQGCSSLREVPLLNTSSATNMQDMFRGCSSLREVPLLNTSSATNMKGMFYGCSSLREVPLLDTSSVTNISWMFQNASSIIRVPLLDTSSATDMQGMFYGCSSLREVPQFNTSRCQSIFQMFDRSGLADFRLDMATIINCNQIFNLCKWLLRAHFTFTSLMTGAQNWFNISRAITEMSFADTCSLAGVTSANNMFANSTSNSIPKGCVNYTLVKQVCEMMLRGIPNYTADSYPMYFESGSTVTDDAAGTLQSLVEQCQAMGWAIYNLTINPYA